MIINRLDDGKRASIDNHVKLKQDRTLLKGKAFTTKKPNNKVTKNKKKTRKQNKNKLQKTNQKTNQKVNQNKSKKQEPTQSNKEPMKKKISNVFVSVISGILAVLVFILILSIFYQMLSQILINASVNVLRSANTDEYERHILDMQIFSTFIAPALTGATFYLLSKLKLYTWIKKLLSRQQHNKKGVVKDGRK